MHFIGNFKGKSRTHPLEVCFNNKVAFENEGLKNYLFVIVGLGLSCLYMKAFTFTQLFGFVGF